MRELVDLGQGTPEQPHECLAPEVAELDIGSAAVGVGTTAGDEWIDIPFDLSQDKLTIVTTDVDALFLDKMAQQIRFLKETVAKARRTFLTQDIDNLTEHTLMFQSFAPSELWKHLLDVANKSRQHVGIYDRLPFTPRELELLIRLLFALAVYDKSLTQATDHPECFPLVDHILQQFEGGRERAMGFIRSLDVGSQINLESKHHHGSSWDMPFSPSKDLTKIERIMTEKSSEMVLDVGVTDLLIDDDKCRHLACPAEEVGWSNIMLTSAGGLFAGSVMRLHGETFPEQMKRLLGTMTGTPKPNLRGTTLGGDRDYSEDQHMSLVENMHHINTVKRGPNLPMTFGGSNYRAKVEQRRISESGPRTVFRAKRISAGKTTELLVYRNGSFRNTMLCSSLPDLSGDHWTMVPKSRQSLDRWLEAAFQPTGTIEVLIPESECISLTEVQDDESWFEMRLFRFTSTTSYATIQSLDRERLAPDEATLIESHLSIQLQTAADLAEANPRTKYASYLAMSVGELANNTKPLLQEMLNAFQIKGLSQTKDTNGMAKAILAKAGQAPTPDRTGFEKFVRNSFVKPTRTSKMSSSDERYVIVELGHILQENDIIQVNEVPVQLGLVCRKDKPYLATSIAGIWPKAKVGIDKDKDFKQAPVGVEIEAMTAESSQTTGMATNQVLVDWCKFGDETFQSTITSKSYRVQMLHHATVLKLEYVLYVAAMPTRVRRCLLIEFPVVQRNTYEAILSNYITQNVLPIYGDPPAPWPNMTEKNLTINGYVIEPETVAYKLGVWRALSAMVDRNKGPIPQLKHFLPTIVVYWEYGKLFTDTTSRCLKNLKLPIARASPALVYVVRNIMTIAINSMIASKLLKEGKEKIDTGCRSYHDFQEHVASKMTLADMAMDLAKNFGLLGIDRGGSESSEPPVSFSPSKQIRHESEDEPPASEVDEVTQVMQRKPKVREKLSKYFMEPAPKRMRLTPAWGHYCISIKHPKVRKRCSLCSRKVATFCCICEAFLCNERLTETALSCVEVWHSDVSLPDVKKERTENLKARRQQEEGEEDESGTGSNTAEELVRGSDATQQWATAQVPVQRQMFKRSHVLHTLAREAATECRKRIRADTGQIHPETTVAAQERGTTKNQAQLAVKRSRRKNDCNQTQK